MSKTEKKMIRDKHLPIKVCLGCEVLYDIHYLDRILEDLESGRLSSLNRTKYVLTELFYGMGSDCLFYLNRLLEKSCIVFNNLAEKVILNSNGIDNIAVRQSV